MSKIDDMLSEYGERVAKMEALRAEAELLINSYSSNDELKEMAKRQPVVLTYIDGDSYGGDAIGWPGVGDPIVVVFDGGRYDKYNRCGDENPYEDWEEELTKLKEANTDAYETLREWVEDAAEACGVDDDEEDEDE